MGQQNKRSSLTLSVDSGSFYGVVPIDTSTRHVNRKSSSTPTPVNTFIDRRRSKSSLPALEDIKEQNKQQVDEQPIKGYMKGRRPRKEPVLAQLQEGEADQTNDDSPPTTKK